MKSSRRHSPLAFLVILALTVLVWFAVAMSEPRDYHLEVRVEMTGYDAKRYAVVQADSVMTLQVQSTGFNAMIHSLKGEPLVLRLNVNGEAVRRYERQGENSRLICRSVAVNDLGDRIKELLSERGMKMVRSAKDSLLLVLSERKSRVFKVDISAVKMEFAEGYGLYGEPTVTPSEVTLFGDEESLSKIQQLSVKPLNVNGLKETKTFALEVDNTWQGKDIYASVESVSLKVPVEQYVEKEYTLPVVVERGDSLVRMNLYPDHVTLKVWVPRSDLASVSAEKFSATADYGDVSAHRQSLKVRLARFPKNVRLHSLSPEEVQYTIIK